MRALLVSSLLRRDYRGKHRILLFLNINCRLTLLRRRAYGDTMTNALATQEPIKDLSEKQESPVAGPPTPIPDVGLKRIASLLSGTDPRPLSAADVEAVGMVQDLLTGLGFQGLANIFSPDYGVLGPMTTSSVQQFQQKSGLQSTGLLDAETLKRMLETRATSPLMSRVYVVLVLKKDDSAATRVVTTVSQMVSAREVWCARFERRSRGVVIRRRCCLQTEQTGFIEILKAYRNANPQLFVQIFGAGDSTVADGLLRYLAGPSGGVNPATGSTTDPNYDLVRDPWISRFRSAAV